MFSLNKGGLFLKKNAVTHVKENKNLNLKDLEVKSRSAGDSYVYSVVDNYQVTGNFTNSYGPNSENPLAVFNGNLQVNEGKKLDPSTMEPVGDIVSTNPLMEINGNLAVKPGTISVDPLVTIDGSLNVTGSVWAHAYRFNLGDSDASNNIAVGNNVLMKAKILPDAEGEYADSIATYNLGLGHNALSELTQGFRNTALGNYALTSGKEINQNVAVGHSAMNGAGSEPDSTGADIYYNTAVGYSVAQGAGSNIKSNTAIGTFSQYHQNNCEGNVSVGYDSLNLVDGGSKNTCIGTLSLADSVSANNNIAIGFYSGRNVGDDCSGNIFIGDQTGIFPDDPEAHAGGGGVVVRTLTDKTIDNKTYGIGESGTGVSKNTIVLGDNILVPSGSENLVVIGNHKAEVTRPDSDQKMDLGTPGYRYKNYYGEIINDSLNSSVTTNSAPTFPTTSTQVRVGGELITTIYTDLAGFTCANETNNNLKNIKKILGIAAPELDQNDNPYMDTSDPYVFHNNSNNVFGAQISLFYNRIPALQYVVGSQDIKISLLVINPSALDETGNAGEINSANINIGSTKAQVIENNSNFLEYFDNDFQAGQRPSVPYMTYLANTAEPLESIIMPGGKVYLLAIGLDSNELRNIKVKIDILSTCLDAPNGTPNAPLPI